MKEFMELETDPAYCEKPQKLVIKKSAIIGMVDHGPYTKLLLSNGMEIEVIEPIRMMMEALEGET